MLRLYNFWARIKIVVVVEDCCCQAVLKFVGIDTSTRLLLDICQAAGIK